MLRQPKLPIDTAQLAPEGRQWLVITADAWGRGKTIDAAIKQIGQASREPVYTCLIYDAPIGAKLSRDGFIVYRGDAEPAVVVYRIRKLKLVEPEALR